LLNAGLHDPNPTSRAFIEACRELGYPTTEDFNGPQMEGTGWHHVNIRDGKRCSAREGYLFPALARLNVTLSANAQATRLLFEGRRCVGVEYSQNGALQTARAEQEVLVCAGAIESPKVLLLSGIGEPNQLQQFAIPVVAALPGVGENFHNHVLTGLIQGTARPVPPGNLNLSEAALFYKSDPAQSGPDIQIAFVHVPFDIIVGQANPNSVSILPGVVRPTSRGWVRLASGNPLDKPLVNPNYLGTEEDTQRLVDAVKRSRDIFATRAFSEWVTGEVLPGPGVATDAQLREFVRQRADSYHHQAGSCKMGTDERAVVDPSLQVRGLERLRVVDASVMPVVPSGNCHAGILMIAEKCAELIKASYGLGVGVAPGPSATTVGGKTMMTFHHVSLNCQDVLAIERFYSKHFGFQRARVIDLPDGRQIVFLKGGGVYLELFPAQGERPASQDASGEGLLSPGVRNFSFQVDSVDAQLAAMGDEARITFGPLSFDDFIPGWRSAWLADPEGNVFQVTQGFTDQDNPPPPPA
jgi:choline dehydrogenase